MSAKTEETSGKAAAGPRRSKRLPSGWWLLPAVVFGALSWGLLLYAVFG